jgi:hypothetical protein
MSLEKPGWYYQDTITSCSITTKINRKYPVLSLKGVHKLFFLSEIVLCSERNKCSLSRLQTDAASKFLSSPKGQVANLASHGRESYSNDDIL